MVNLEVLKHKDFGDVRTVTINNEPWFVGNDVAGNLGYINYSDALYRHVHEEDRQIIQNSGITSFEIPTRGLTVINESGLYSLILKSKLPTARAFQRWITLDVLPTLRKTGTYSVRTNEISCYNAAVEDDKLILAKANLILDSIVKENEELLRVKDRVIAEKESVIVEQDKVIEETQRFINQISVSKNSIRVRDLAQLCCKNGITIGQNRLFEQLRIWQLICRRDNSPYQRYVDMGLFEIVEFPIETSKGVEIKRSLRITGKGQEYIVVRLLKERMREG